MELSRACVYETRSPSYATTMYHVCICGPFFFAGRDGDRDVHVIWFASIYIILARFPFCGARRETREFLSCVSGRRKSVRGITAIGARSDLNLFLGSVT